MSKHWKRPAFAAGFTLIELLIVVAIIAILAAIAVPNFLEAQTRAKVSRAKSDMRTVATAIEAYAVDYNHHPWTINDFAADLDGYGNGRQDDMLTVPDSITTPIAYLTGHITDVFRVGKNVSGPNTASSGRPFQSGDPQDMTFMYLNMTQDKFWLDTDGFISFYDEESWPFAVQGWGLWQMRSVGPMALYPGASGTDFDNVGYTSINAIYDPTNGTISVGQIIRTQKSSDGQQRDFESNE